MNCEYILDGSKITSLELFYDAIGELLLPGVFWGKNLDALNDILSGGFNLPESPFELVWLNISQSKEVFGYEYTVRWYREKVEQFVDEPENHEYYSCKLSEAKREVGETIFDWLFEILSENSSEVISGRKEIRFRM